MMGARRSTLFAVAIAALGAACSGPASSSTTLALDVETFDQLEVVVLDAETVEAVIAGERAGPEYNSDPPTSGARSELWARCGIYRQEVPDVYQVASLARGTVIIQYRSTFAADGRDTVEQIGRGLESRVIVAPNSNLDAPVVLTAWGAMMRLSFVDPARMGAFVDQYGGQGPTNESCVTIVDET
jgi:hypothetical protein